MNLENVWATRLKKADTRYTEWSDNYKCDALENYYRGRQWAENMDEEPYTMNMIYSTIKIKLATYLFSQPKALVSPRPGASDYNLEKAIESATVKEDVLNTLLQHPKSNFHDEVKLCALDSFFRFGILEVGYAADWILNPKINKPYHRSDKNPSHEGKDRVISFPSEIPENERVFFKRVHAKRFRIGGIESSSLLSCNWVGYYDFVYKRDLLEMPGLTRDAKNKIADSMGTSSADQIFVSSIEQAIYKNSDVIKIWHIWDNRAGKRLLVLDSGDEIFSKEFSRLPLFDLRWDLDIEGWYPIPPVFQWISPQNEINEAREQARNHRRRFTRKYAIQKGAMDQEEIDKFTHGPDGTVVQTNRDPSTAIYPISSPDLGSASSQSLVVTKDDFNIVSGTSSEARGQSDRTTATQAKLIDARSQVRESAEQAEVIIWMKKVFRETLLVVRDHFTQPIVTKISGPRSSAIFQDYNTNDQYGVVQPIDLDDGYDFDVLIDIVSLSPVSNEEEKRKFIEFNALVTQFPHLAMSPMLIRETAYRVGYRNEQVIKEMMNAALLTQMGQMAQGQMGAQGMGQGQLGQAITEQASPNTGSEIASQLENQLLQ